MHLPQGVYAISDEVLLPPDIFLGRVQAALEAGVSILQYRNKKADAELRRAQCQQLRALCDRHGTHLLINDDVDLCLDIGADGVHLGQGDIRLTEARARLGEESIIGVTCHSSVELAWQAQQEGASYVAFGRFFASQTKPLAPAATLDVLTNARQRLTVPLVAIGGINAENGPALIEAGADLLAVIHYLFAFPDVAHRVRQLNSLFPVR